MDIERLRKIVSDYDDSLDIENTLGCIDLLGVSCSITITEDVLIGGSVPEKVILSCSNYSEEIKEIRSFIVEVLKRRVLKLRSGLDELNSQL